MANSSEMIAAGREVELIIRKLGSVSTVPEVAAKFLSHLAGEGVNAAMVTDIIESDAALSAKVLSLAHDEGVVFSDGVATVSEAVTKLGGSVLRDSLLSVKVFQSFDADSDPDGERALPRKQLAVHALAVACCAKEIAEAVLDSAAGKLAFSAGLLHDIGKLAIDEVMPRSFEKIIAQARSAGGSLCFAERENLGIDHTLIGKRLAEKWSLPREVVYAIWLHHSDIEVISANMPGSKIALVVQLADIVARQSAIGHSGSFDSTDSTEDLCGALGLSKEQLKTIGGNLPEEVSRRSRLLGLGERGGQSAWCDLIAGSAQRLACDNTKLSAANIAKGASAAQMEFVSEFLRDLEPKESAADIVARFGVKLQRHYQTGPVCIYIAGEPEEPFVEMVTVDSFGKTDTVLVNVPAGTSCVSEGLKREFAVCAAAEHASWIFEQTDFRIDLAKSKIAPLLAGGEAVGAVIFEPRMPFDAAQRQEAFSVVSSIAGSVVALAVAKARGGRHAEGFAELLGQLRNRRTESAQSKNIEALAEMAAGAAHELNNPLAVISGRAQLLVDGEKDDEKKKTLQQIQERAGEISQIVEDLMSFARPKAPEFQVVSVPKLIEEALSKTKKKRQLDKIDAEVKDLDEINVRVDSAQVVDALVNILSNCLDSYEEGAGAIIIAPAGGQAGDSFAFTITDSGCGMDAETLPKACQPFFSAPAAGRKRGMGLAVSLRLLSLNNGSMSIASRLSEGTTVTVALPKA